MHSAELIKTLNNKLDAETSLSPQRFDQVNKIMEIYVDALLKIEAAKDQPAFIETIDFPDFVADLVQGTFEAIVDASMQQMDAYADLLHNLTETLDEYMTDSIKDNPADEFLAKEFEFDFLETIENRPGNRIDCEKMKRILLSLGIKFAIDCPPTKQQLKSIRETIAIRSQQKLLTTMLLMGINRIVVDDGEIKA